MTEEQRITLSASGHVTEAGKFEVVAMTAGEGNGWQFGEAVLRESLSLWDGATCFIDHGSWFGAGRSRTLPVCSTIHAGRKRSRG
jgi:hypothetical protein